MNSDRTLVDVAVGVVLRDDGTVLLADRPVGKPYAGYWEFPGGKLEIGETAEQALARELHEELGIEVQRSVAWLVMDFEYPHAHVKLHFRRVMQWKGEITAREGQRWQFCHIHEPPPQPLLPAALPVWRHLALPSVCLFSPQTATNEQDALSWIDQAIARGARLLVWDETQLGAALNAQALPQLAQRVSQHGVQILMNQACLEGVNIGGLDGNVLSVLGLLQDATARSQALPEQSWATRVAMVRQLEQLNPEQVQLCDWIVRTQWPDTDAPNTHTCAKPIYQTASLSLDQLELAWQHGAHGLAVHGLPTA